MDLRKSRVGMMDWRKTISLNKDQLSLREIGVPPRWELVHIYAKSGFHPFSILPFEDRSTLDFQLSAFVDKSTPLHLIIRDIYIVFLLILKLDLNFLEQTQTSSDQLF